MLEFVFDDPIISSSLETILLSLYLTLYFQFPKARNDKVGQDGKPGDVSKSPKIQERVAELPHANHQEKNDPIDRTLPIPSFAAPEQKSSGQPSPTFIIKPAGNIHQLN